MSDYDTRQISVILERVEQKIDRLEAHAVTRPEIEALRERVGEIQEAQKWLTRAVAGAMITAIFGSLTAAVIGVIIRLPPL